MSVPEDEKSTYDELQGLEWVRIDERPYVLKLKMYEGGYTVMLSNLAAVYGEHMYGEVIQERFQLLNPYAEMLPHIILKHVKHAIENIVPADPTHKKTELKITYQPHKYFLDFKIASQGMNFIFFLELKLLQPKQFRSYVVKPTLLKALTLDEENAALRKKIEDLEGRNSSPSTSGSSERKNVKLLCLAMQLEDPPKSILFDALVHVLSYKTILPECSNAANLLSTEGDHSASTSSSLYNRQNGSQTITTCIPYEEDKPETSVKSHSVVVDVEDSAISTNTEHSKSDNSDTDDCDNSNSNLLAKRKHIKSLTNPITPKREIVEEDIKEESASKSPSGLKPSPAKKKKYLRF